MQSVHQCALYFFAFLLPHNVRWVTFPRLTIAFPGDTQWSFQVSKSVPFLEPLSLSVVFPPFLHVYVYTYTVWKTQYLVCIHHYYYMQVNTHLSIHTCITLHCITLHCIALHYISWRDVTLRCSYSYSYSCRQCVALHVHIPNPDIIPNCRSGRWFPISMIPLHFCTGFQHFLFLRFFRYLELLCPERCFIILVSGFGNPRPEEKETNTGEEGSWAVWNLRELWEPEFVIFHGLVKV